MITTELAVVLTLASILFALGAGVGRSIDEMARPAPRRK